MSAEVVRLTPPDPERLAWFEMNDLGNAERLKARSGGLLRYVSKEEGGYWIAYDGKRWNRAEGLKRATQLAHEVARSIRDEVAALGEQIRKGRLPDGMVKAVGEESAKALAQEKLKALHAWAIKSGNAAQTRGMLAQASDEMVIDEKAFDTDPLALNVENGTLRFVKGGDGRWTVRFSEHNPDDFITRLAAMRFDAEARCPAWTDRLELIQPDEDQRAQLQVLMGYALTGLTSDQQFYLQQGPGGDGKSATWSTFTKLMGDYHRRAKVQSFLEGPQRSGSDHSSDIARLSGDVRLVTCSEPPKRAAWNANVLKEATGSDTMTARPLREAEIEFTPHWKLVVECNGLPRVPVSDDGFWRRVRVIQWPFQFLKQGVAPEQPHVLQARLLGEGPGILNWAIAGVLRWLEEGRVPESRTTKRATAEYRRSSDPFDEWYLDRCVTNDRSERALAKELYEDFKLFCEKSGLEKVMAQKSFGLKLAEKQHERHKSQGVIWRIGIRLKTQGERDAAERAEEAEDQAAGVAVPAGVDAGSGARSVGADWVPGD